MIRYKLKNGGRKKALFGSEEAAILGAAAINVAGTLSAASMGANATKNAAKSQADATIKAANKQAESIKTQNANAKELQESSQEFTRAQNEENRDLQKQIQMNLQMLTGQQTVNDKLEAARLQVKNGGSTKQNYNTLLRGRYNNNNIPFTVTDGGNVLPLGITPEGYDLYEIIGNDHEHYHKAQGGKNKTGVGIKFNNGNVIEGEGNQNTNQGELLLVTPTDAQFISKHSIAGFNPARAVLAGMHPIQAFAIQETIKNKLGISDDGKSKSKNNIKRRMAFAGGTSVLNDETSMTANVPDFSIDTITPTSTGVAYIIQNNAESDKNNVNYGSTANHVVAKYGTNIRKKLSNGGRVKASNGNWWNMAGAGITSLGNIGGAWITQSGNNEAMRYISAANTQAAGLIADAYRQMKGIDLSSIRKEDYAAPHAMAAVRAPIVNINPQLTQIERARQRRAATINRNMLSGAAKLNSLARVESDAYDQRSNIYGRAEQQAEQIKQGNVERITQVANENANRDAQANREWANAYLNLMQYNNDIENQKISGIAQAQANALTGNAQIAASTAQANAQGWGSAMANSAQAFGNTIESSVKAARDRQNVLIGADADQQYRAAMMNGSRSEAQALYNMWKNGTADQKRWAANLNAKWNGKLGGNIKTTKTSSPLNITRPSSIISLKNPTVNTPFDFSNLWLHY